MQRTERDSILCADATFELFMAVARCHSVLRHQLKATARSCQLNLTSALLLVVCHRKPDRNQRELAEQLAISPAQVCAALEHLRTSGLTIAARSDEDRRCQLWRLTPEGIRQAKQFARQFDAATHEFAEDIDAFMLDLLEFDPRLSVESIRQRKDEAA